MRRSFLPSIFGNDRNESSAFSSLQKEIDRVFDEFKGVMPGFESGFPSAGVSTKVNVSETDKDVEITVELPGVSEEDVEISVTSNVLTIKGEKSASKEEEKKDYHLVERSYGSFSRTIPLAFDINPDNVTADFKDGVLTVTVKKPPEAVSQAKKIKITKSS